MLFLTVVLWSPFLLPACVAIIASLAVLNGQRDTTPGESTRKLARRIGIANVLILLVGVVLFAALQFVFVPWIVLSVMLIVLAYLNFALANKPAQ